LRSPRSSRTPTSHLTGPAETNALTRIHTAWFGLWEVNSTERPALMDKVVRHGAGARSSSSTRRLPSTAIGWFNSPAGATRTGRDHFIVGRARPRRRLVQKAPGAHRRKVVPIAVIGGLRRCVRAHAANVHAARSGWQTWLSRCASLIACVAKRQLD
jgi:hypothetical protein